MSYLKAAFYPTTGGVFPDFRNLSDPAYDTNDDLGPSMKNFMDHGVKKVVGLGDLYPKRSLMEIYLNPLTTNQAEFASYQSRGLYQYQHFPLVILTWQQVLM